LTTPIAIAIGLGVRNSYNAGSMTAVSQLHHSSKHSTAQHNILIQKKSNAQRAPR